MAWVLLSMITSISSKKWKARELLLHLLRAIATLQRAGQLRLLPCQCKLVIHFYRELLVRTVKGMPFG
eukprot:gene19543-19295_t